MSFRLGSILLVISLSSCGQFVKHTIDSTSTEIVVQGIASQIIEAQIIEVEKELNKQKEIFERVKLRITENENLILENEQKIEHIKAEIELCGEEEEDCMRATPAMIAKEYGYRNFYTQKLINFDKEIVQEKELEIKRLEFKLLGLRSEEKIEQLKLELLKSKGSL